MAKDASFDIVSEVDLQEVDNALNQAKKEIGQRYDFKNSKVEIAFEDEEIKVLAEDEFKLKAVIDVIESKLINRKISIKNLDFQKIESASGGTVRQKIKIKQGIEMNIAKEIVKEIKNSKIKVQAQIMNDQVRVSGKNRDDLQAVIQLLKSKDYNLDLQFTNYRS